MANCNSYKDEKPNISEIVLNRILLAVFLIIIISITITFLI